jgi:methylated-DNA-[protein]-cysteine S-methyltransferase
MGWVGLMATPAGISKLGLPARTKPEALNKLGDLSGYRLDENYFEALVAKLQAYFAGRPVSFYENIDIDGFSAFQTTIWKLARRVPYGRTASYRELARQAGKPGASRAVGQALKHNPVPIIVPCHRIIRSDGSPGGFFGGQGLKLELLELENGLRQS